MSLRLFRHKLPHKHDAPFFPVRMLRVYARGFLQETVGSPDAAHTRKLRDGVGKAVRALAEADTFYLLFGELSRPLEEEILHRFGERCIFIFIPENAGDLLHF